MRVPILIPEAAPYGVAILVVYSLSAPALTSHWRASVALLRRVPFMTVYGMVLLVICLWGAVWFTPTDLLTVRSWGAGLCCLAGVALALPAVRWDRAIGRRGRCSRGVHSSAVPGPGNVNSRRALAADELSGTGGVLVGVAILEEAIYRGFLIKASFLLESPVLIGLAVLGCTACFSLAHIRFGWVQVLAKTPLSVLALGLTLVAGTVLPAMLLHVGFNLAAWRALRAQT